MYKQSQSIITLKKHFNYHSLNIILFTEVWILLYMCIIDIQDIGTTTSIVSLLLIEKIGWKKIFNTTKPKHFWFKYIIKRITTGNITNNQCYIT